MTGIMTEERIGIIVTFFLVLIPYLAIKYFRWRSSRSRLYQLAERLPGPKSSVILGNAESFMSAPSVIFKNVVQEIKEFPDVMKMWIGPRLLVFLLHPADVELILSSQEHIDKAPEYKFFKPWLGEGLLITTGEKWKLHRKLIAPSFHLNILKSFLGVFNKNSLDVVKKLEKEDGKEFDCHDYMSEATVEMLLETAMGVDKKAQENGYDYAMAVMKMCDILHLRQTKLWMRPDMLFLLSSYGRLQKQLLSTIHGLTKKVVSLRKADHKSGFVDTRLINNISDSPPEQVSTSDYSYGGSKGLKDDIDEDIGQKKRLAFLDLLISGAQGGVVLNDDEIQNQVDTIMFEGHDTTASASSFFLCVLADRQDIQEKVLDEIDRVFGDSDREVTFQDTLDLKYLERCIMETLRMYPPVPVIARDLKTDLKLVSSDLTVPAGCTVIVGTYKLHRREDTYPNPEHFDPDNFLPERSASRHYYSFIPFSAGPRSCVGRKYAMLKLKVLLTNILRQYRVLPGVPMKDWVLQADIILKRTDGFRVRIEKRKPKSFPPSTGI
uniref:Cytochrome P450 4g15 n=1 Tax=Lygus hesperus TaxID=30085 RepID=A0A146LUW8_LYGHE